MYAADNISGRTVFFKNKYCNCENVGSKSSHCKVRERRKSQLNSTVNVASTTDNSDRGEKKKEIYKRKKKEEYKFSARHKIRFDYYKKRNVGKNQ